VEGLLLAQVVTQLQTQRPFRRRGGWRFPEADTFVLPLEHTSIMIHSRPPEPLLELLQQDRPSRAAAREGRRTLTNFQQLLVARTQGELLAVSQVKLDRIVRLDFAGEEGFVSSPPVSLWLELAGRNSNLILVDESGTILGAQREVTGGTNRYRQIRSGLQYRPPPPYDKADPRSLDAPQLEALLTGRSLRELRSLLDGIGPKLTRTLAALSGLDQNRKLASSDLPAVTAALAQLLEDPARAVQETLGAADDLAGRLDAGRRAAAQARLEPVLQRNRKLFARQLADLDRLRQAGAGASELREQADLLMAYRPRPAAGERRVTLTDFTGEEVTIALEPGLDAVATAQRFYARARRRETRLAQALEREPELRDLLADAESQLAELPGLPTARLLELAAELPAARPGQFRTPPGIRVTGPHGYTVIIGRNARENDQVTFGIARSRDVWLHVQGYRGSHVIVQAGNREVPFDVIVFAAQLAAGHSQAADSSNVAVDYTLRKDVWRVRGGAAGAVHFTGQKTVYVTPVRRADAET
jgi:predicted ribosome quality control (RQC) complex YloA/Tae2 family protein